MKALCIGWDDLRQIDWLAAGMLLVGMLMMAAFIARMTVDYFRRTVREGRARRRRTARP